MKIKKEGDELGRWRQGRNTEKRIKITDKEEKIHEGRWRENDYRVKKK